MGQAVETKQPKKLADEDATFPPPGEVLIAPLRSINAPKRGEPSFHEVVPGAIVKTPCVQGPCETCETVDLKEIAN